MSDTAAAVTISLPFFSALRAAACLNLAARRIEPTDEQMADELRSDAVAILHACYVKERI
jgi:hypothetical protein